MAKRLKKTVVLVGMMGAGKTAVGTALAKMLDVPFCDLDDEIESAAQRSIPEIFERDGEAFFRARESEILERLLQGSPYILSTGGGAFVAAKNRDLIARYGLSLWLQADVELLWQRVRHKTTRPLLHTPNPRETLQKIYDERRHFYAMADMAVAARAEYSIDDMALRLQDMLKTRKDIWQENK